MLSKVLCPQPVGIPARAACSAWAGVTSVGKHSPAGTTERLPCPLTCPPVITELPVVLAPRHGCRRKDGASAQAALQLRQAPR